jgi:hypothetical protein
VVSIAIYEFIQIDILNTAAQWVLEAFRERISGSLPETVPTEANIVTANCSNKLSR